MILCCGESLMDMVPQGDALRPLAGGAVFNTAIALGRLGVEVEYLWPLSRDGVGELLLERLTEAGVNVARCPRSDLLTTLALVDLSNGDARYRFYDDNTAGRMFATDDLPALEGVKALFIGGISLVRTPCAETVETLAMRAAKAGIPIMIDPNIRPAYIDDEAAYRARLDRLFANAAFAKISADDLEWLWPDLGEADAVGALHALGVGLVLITDGAKGVRLYAKAQAPVFVPAHKAELVDTIGAGDTFNAGFLAALAASGAFLGTRFTLPAPDLAARCVDFGARAAAITVSRAGANPPWAKELPLDSYSPRPADS